MAFCRANSIFSEEEIKDLIEYDKELFIRFVPEIEMPGHALSFFPVTRSTAARVVLSNSVVFVASKKTSSVRATTKPFHFLRVFLTM